MKVLIINVICGVTSTGRICAELAETLSAQGHEVKVAYGREPVPDRFRKYAVRIGNDLDGKFHGIHTRLFDKHGFASKRVTSEFLKWADQYNPDMVWMHNLHGYYINIEMLFGWLKSRPKMQVKWTLHDCWSFTGHCPYFTMAGCDKWKTGCSNCPQKKKYPASYLKDNSLDNYKRKKKAFQGVKNMTIITPSRWLAELVKQSFLQEYPVEVQHNTIDTTVFKPTPSDFRKAYGLYDKKIILGAASIWDERKGLKDFVALSRMLSKDYAMVLVGLNKKQIETLPRNILAIERTHSTTELAEIYTAADVFLNLTYEDNYPTVNLESQACGTPVITYRTGGSVEYVPPEQVAEVGDLQAVLSLIEQICK